MSANNTKEMEATVSIRQFINRLGELYSKLVYCTVFPNSMYSFEFRWNTQTDRQRVRVE